MNPLSFPAEHTTEDAISGRHTIRRHTAVDLLIW